MTNNIAPEAPAKHPPDPSVIDSRLYQAVKEAIASLPIYFRTETRISGIMATDLHTLNTVLGATIEEQVVRTLNMIRNVWDPDEKYALYSFVRQAQTFPDVLLRRADGDILLGIELKGWYLLAKEAEPSLRFQTTAAACAEQDLIVVVPWALGNVISGSPVLFEPFLESARYAAEYRNHHWQHIRKTKHSTDIESPGGVAPYPSKADQILDKPLADGGGNFGRLARTGLMNAYVRKLNDERLCGINVAYWRDFLKMFQENATEEQVRTALEKLRKRVEGKRAMASDATRSAMSILRELETLLDAATAG